MFFETCARDTRVARACSLITSKASRSGKRKAGAKSSGKHKLDGVKAKRNLPTAISESDINKTTHEINTTK